LEFLGLITPEGYQSLLNVPVGTVGAMTLSSRGKCQGTLKFGWVDTDRPDIHRNAGVSCCIPLQIAGGQTDLASNKSLNPAILLSHTIPSMKG
jgi:hypothetical protein